MPLIIYPKTRFTLTERQASGKLSKAGIWRLERKKGVPGLEKTLAGYLPQMPQMYLRGSSDTRINGNSSFLISSTPIEYGDRWVFSPRECKPPLFFKKLFASTVEAWTIGKNHLFKEADASEVVLSIDKAFYRITKNNGEMSRNATPPSNWLRAGDRTFLAAGRSYNQLAQLRYPGEAFSCLSGMDMNRFYAQCLQINGFIYRDVLRLLLKLAKNNWNG